MNDKQEFIISLLKHHWSLLRLPAVDRVRCRMDDLSFKSLEMRESIEKLAEDCCVERHVVRRVLREDEGKFYKQDKVRKTWYRRILEDKEEFEAARLKILSPMTRALRLLLRMAQGSEDFSLVISDSVFLEQANISGECMRLIRKRLPEIGWFVDSGKWNGAPSVYQWNSETIKIPEKAISESPKYIRRKPQKFAKEAPNTYEESPKSHVSNSLKNKAENTESVRAFSLKSVRALRASALSSLEESKQRSDAELSDAELCKKYEDQFPGYPAGILRSVLRARENA